MVMARSFSVKKVRKQMYPATFNFMDNVDGAEPSGWTTNNGAGCTTTVITSLDGHRKVLQLYDNNGATKYDIEIDFDSAQTSGTIELWFHTTDNTLDHILQLLQADNTIAIQVDLNAIAGVGDDTTYHYKIKFDCAPDTYDHTLNGTSIAMGVAFTNVVTNIITIKFIGTNADSGYYNYIDAIGYSWDANYKIGDNCFWRHYKDQDSNFESEDVGTSGTSISFIDTKTGDIVDIVNEYNEHKKILRLDRNGTDTWGYNNFSDQTSGTVEFWVKTTDATHTSHLSIDDDATWTLQFMIQTEKFRYHDGVAKDIADCLDNTWYHIKLEWYADNTFDVWIDGILELDGGDFRNVMTDGLDKLKISCTVADHTTYLDAISYSWTTGNEVGDNRTFDYNDSYTREDITTLVKNVIYKNEIYKWREASLKSETSYENTEVFFQIYDINSKLAMEADIKNRAQISKEYLYSLRDKNQDDLENRSSNTFTTSKIHDPTDSTSMLKIILPNVSEVNGDLILIDADTKTDTYSPVTKNYPDYLMLRDIADLADSVVIIQADGKVYLDDNKASGTALDFDTEADKDKMTAAPLVTDILETINYFEIFGAINPDTGTRFFKIIDNVGEDKKKSWRYTNNEFRNQTDIDNYATALKNRTAAIKNVKFTAQSLGVHNMGETLNYKYVDALYNIPQANYYIIFESIDFDLNENIIILSEGMIESSKYAAVYELPENYNDSFASEIYETDIITPNLNLLPFGGSEGPYGIATIKTQYAMAWFYLPPNVDDGRDLIIDFVFRNAVHGARTTDGELLVAKYATDGSLDSDNIIPIESFDAVFTANNGFYHISRIVAATLLEADHHYFIQWENVETDNGNATTCYVSVIQLRYYMKRSL